MEFLGVAILSDLAGSSSIVIESEHSGILHCGKGEDVE